MTTQQEAGEQEEDEEEDYIDSEDEKQEGEKAPHENAFVFIDNFGKLVYVDPEEGERDEAHLEEKQEEVGPRLVLLHYRAKSCVAAGAVIPQPVPRCKFVHAGDHLPRIYLRRSKR